jgi:hypothetical protein
MHRRPDTDTHTTKNSILTVYCRLCTRTCHEKMIDILTLSCKNDQHLKLSCKRWGMHASPPWNWGRKKTSTLLFTVVVVSAAPWTYHPKVSPSLNLTCKSGHHLEPLVLKCHHLEPLVLKCHHLDPLVLKCHHLEPLVLKCHHLEPLVLKFHHLEPLVLKCHYLEPLVLKCHHLEPLVLKCHHLEPLVLKCHHLEPLVLKCHHLEPLVLKCHHLELLDLKCHHLWTWHAKVVTVLKLSYKKCPHLEPVLCVILKLPCNSGRQLESIM